MLESLTHTALFQDLDPDQLAELEPLFEYYTCPSQTVIFEQGDPAERLYLIVEGAVSIHYKPYDGPTIRITHLRDGDVFGWSAVIGSPQYTSTIISDTPLQAICMRGEDLWKLTLQHPDFGKIVLGRLARVVSTRWKNSQSQVQAILNHGMAKVNSRKKKRSEKTMDTVQNHTQEEQLRSLLESLSAYVEQYHGGSVEFVSFDGTTLKVKLGGACLGCPLLPATLQGWVAGTVHQFFPNVNVVEQR